MCVSDIYFEWYRAFGEEIDGREEKGECDGVELSYIDAVEKPRNGKI